MVVKGGTTDPVGDSGSNITLTEDGGAYNEDVIPHVEVTDLHLDHLSVTLNGATDESDTPITEDGAYQLEVSAFDLAGDGLIVFENFPEELPKIRDLLGIHRGDAGLRTAT